MGMYVSVCLYVSVYVCVHPWVCVCCVSVSVSLYVCAKMGSHLPTDGHLSLLRMVPQSTQVCRNLCVSQHNFKGMHFQMKLS